MPAYILAHLHWATIQVRMSPDMLIAYVLWSAYPGCEDAARRELQARFETPAFLSLLR